MLPPRAHVLVVKARVSVRECVLCLPLHYLMLKHHGFLGLCTACCFLVGTRLLPGRGDGVTALNQGVRGGRGT